MARKIKLNQEWELGERIDGGGFGQVFAVKSADGLSAVAKLVPKAPGAQRELLFVDLKGARNVVPVIDSGDTEDSYVLVMPRATKSLRTHLDEAGGVLGVAELLSILTDVMEALVDLDGSVVHRDLKPENILLLAGKWCLADFGISRYAESTTAPDTQKYAFTPAYAAPERWRAERATIATDVYSLGVIAFEMACGARPFLGPDLHDFRHQHLHDDAPDLHQLPASLASLIKECLYKAPEARPRPANLAARLPQIQNAKTSAGLERLRAANLQEVQRKGEAARLASEHRSEIDQRKELLKVAVSSMKQVGDALLEAISTAAPSVDIHQEVDWWSLSLNGAQLELGKTTPVAIDPWDFEPPAFDVIAQTYLMLRIPRDRHEYEGRSHSLWYCDAKQEGYFQWFETAFMLSPLTGQSTRMKPFAQEPGKASAKALWNGVAEFQLAWPFTPITLGDLDQFIDRWADWFAAAAQRKLQRPSSMPERKAEGSWRRK